MKRLVALMMCAVSLGAAAQFPNLPYNPDENGDGLIGVVDLQGLLANYGNEFASAVVSEDGESAISYIGTMNFPSCAAACRNLPGHWELPDLEDLGLVWSNVSSGSPVWLNAKRYSQVSVQLYRWRPNNNQIDGTSNANEVLKCYCAARQLPRVEYFTCKASCSDGYTALDDCVNEKLAEGWYPLQSQRQQQVYNDCFWQPLWRWAE